MFFFCAAFILTNELKPTYRDVPLQERANALYGCRFSKASLQSTESARAKRLHEIKIKFSKMSKHLERKFVRFFVRLLHQSLSFMTLPFFNAY